MTPDRRVLVHPDTSSLAGAVAARFFTTIIDLLDVKPEVHIVLTGGRLGISILAAINESAARDSINWGRLRIWWGDERWLPSAHADRNERQAREALLDHVPVLPANVHAFPASDDGMDLDAAAAAYAAELATAATDDASAPRFDITLLGVGPDGHIASLFPQRSEIQVTDATVVAVRHSPKDPPERLSLTLGAINGSDRVWIALSGADKASALGLALAGATAEDVPVAGAHGIKRTLFFVDGAAAADVPGELISREE